MAGDLERRLGHEFAEPALLAEALTHPSWGSGQGTRRDYERMEFLGDRVLGLAVAGEVFGADEGANAGEMAVRYNALVRKEAVAEVAREIELGAELTLASGEAQGGGREKSAILANALEAVLGAVYLDAGFDVAKIVVTRLWARRLARAAEATKDPKTRLQERVQRGGDPPPSYDLVETSGPPHDRRFKVEVQVAEAGATIGEGRSKQVAEQAAAADMLARLGEGEDERLPK